MNCALCCVLPDTTINPYITYWNHYIDSNFAQSRKIFPLLNFFLNSGSSVTNWYMYYILYIFRLVIIYVTPMLLYVTLVLLVYFTHITRYDQEYQSNTWRNYHDLAINCMNNW